MRYVIPYIMKDVRQKMVILAGPRQVGKTTLARSMAAEGGSYLNWDIRADQKIIRNISWPKDSSLVVLDELHKYPRWKNYLKGLVDEFRNKPPILVTGSARLDTFRKSGDALTGRFFHYRLHPVDIAEGRDFLPGLSDHEIFQKLLMTGGFPEALLNPENAERLRNNRFDMVLSEDLRDLSKSNSLRNMQILIEILRERTGQLISMSNIAKELSVAPATVKSWVELLERLYLIFIVPPYSKTFTRGLKKESKIYFYDCAAPYEEAARLENLVASTLLKFCHAQADIAGRDFRLNFFRDREKREVDFVLLKNRSVFAAIEVKTSDDNLSPSLKYFHDRAKPALSMQLVEKLSRPLEKNGIRIKDVPSGLLEVLNKAPARQS